MTDRDGSGRFGVGASLPRKEDKRHLEGRGQFVSDLKLAGTQEVAFVRSPHAHARIGGIIVSPAAAGAFRVWEKANRERRQQRLPWKRSNRWNVDSPFLLSSLMRCGRCGYKFCGSTRRRKGHAYPEYVCCGYQASGAKFCARFPVRQELLEDFVIGGYTGSSGEHVPPEVKAWLAELQGLIRNARGEDRS